MAAAGHPVGQSRLPARSRYGCSVVSVHRLPESNGRPANREVLHGLGPPSSELARECASLDRLIQEAAGRITRLDARGAFSAAAVDGVIIDIRPHDARELHGVIPGSLHIPRAVLEWRVAVDSPWRNVYLEGTEQRLILICDHGYSSILAASNLVQLGFYRAGDVIGGFDAWQHNRLPIVPCRDRVSTVGGLPGTGPPE